MPWVHRGISGGFIMHDVGFDARGQQIPCGNDRKESACNDKSKSRSFAALRMTTLEELEGKQQQRQVEGQRQTQVRRYAQDDRFVRVLEKTEGPGKVCGALIIHIQDQISQSKTRDRGFELVAVVLIGDREGERGSGEDAGSACSGASRSGRLGRAAPVILGSVNAACA